MGAKCKGRAAKGQTGCGGEGEDIQKTHPLCAGLPCVLVAPPAVMVGMSHYLEANLLLKGTYQKGLPSENFVALFLPGA